jgi:hypothetical protein
MLREKSGADQQRALDRPIFDPARLPRLQRKRAAMIEEGLESAAPVILARALIATVSAAVHQAMSRAWLGGEARARPRRWRSI